jgi:mutator protein MutT
MESIRVGIAAIIKNSKGEILMIKRKKEPAKNLLGFPGGGIEFGETIEQATMREVKEETGFDVKVGKILTVGEAIEKGKDIHRVVVVSEAEIKGGIAKPSDNAESLFWISLQQIPEMEKNISPYTINNLKNLGYLK